MTRIINTLSEQQYYIAWLKGNIRSACNILKKSKLVISEDTIKNIDFRTVHEISLKSDFQQILTEIDLSFIKETKYKTKDVRDAKNLLINVGNDRTNISILDKNENEVALAELLIYAQKIDEVIETTAEIFSNELEQVNFVRNAPEKFILQPIIIDDSERGMETINVTVTVYEDGALIVDFDLLVHEVPFTQLHNFGNIDNVNYYLARKCLVPEEVSYIKPDNPNFYNKDEISIYEAINSYKSHIYNILGDRLVKDSYHEFKNYSIVKCDNEPNNLDSFNPEFCEDIYWMIHMPKSTAELPKKVYREFVLNHYIISKYSALLVGSKERSVIFTTKEKQKFFDVYSDQLIQIYSLKAYIDPVIRIILMKKLYYHKIWNNNDIFTNHDLNKKENLILLFKDRMTKITYRSYGTVKRCVEYFEKYMVDYLNFNQVEDIIMNFKNKKNLEARENNDRINRRINFLILLITIIFSYDAIESILLGLNKSNIINLMEYHNRIWFLLCIATILYISGNTIKRTWRQFHTIAQKYFNKFITWFINKYIAKG